MLDVSGNLVGVVSTMVGGRPAAGIVTTEMLVALFDRLQAQPQIRLIGF